MYLSFFHLIYLIVRYKQQDLKYSYTLSLPFGKQPNIDISDAGIKCVRPD